MKKILAMILATTLTLSLTACNGSTPSSSAAQAPESSAPQSSVAEPAHETPTSGGKIGVSMPTQSLQRWNQDGSNMKAELEAAGY